MNEVIDGQRVGLFCESAFETLRVERIARQMPKTRGGHIALFMDELLRICFSWIKEHIALNRLEVPTI